MDLSDLVGVFLKNKSRGLQEAMTALEQKKWPVIARFGHMLKGDSGSYGFPELSQMGEEIESLAQLNSPGEAELKTKLEQVAKILKTALSK